ncbi:lipoprotein [Marinobacter lacisalsi]|uniref:Lipoprotein n=1 Tax=Marinobacter lacisalsi TaxID=475979 RepID=A0ABV8QP74_9GAMM
MRTAICLAVLVMMSVLAVGCGQKGPLERPQETDTAVSPADDDARTASE